MSIDLNNKVLNLFVNHNKKNINNNNLDLNVFIKNNDLLYHKKMSIIEKLQKKKKEEEEEKKKKKEEEEEKKKKKKEKIKKIIDKLEVEIKDIKRNDYNMDGYLKKKFLNQTLNKENIKKNKNNLEKIKNIVYRKNGTKTTN